MKVSVNWLREWVSPRADARALADRLTRAGLECDIEPLPALSEGVVVGLIREIRPHPQADRLRVCEVDVGDRAPLTIVCGAANARAGMKAPTALPGARLPDGTEIRQASLRGVESSGMLCSAKELGLAEKSEGLLELDAGARVGQSIAEALALDDALLTLELTPNRGDCLSVAGLARELSAIYGLPLKRPAAPAVKPAGARKIAVRLHDRTDCPRYAGRAVEGLDPAARTPDWMRERLRRSGVRAIHPVVDITNYVMLELGQPLHAFDCARLHGGIHVRHARAGESLQLLNEQVATLTDTDLVIADERGPIALAGVMGGLLSGVGAQTTAIFLESACFRPARVAATGRRLRLPSDALYRFERGVDPGLQREALERATRLVLEICGGVAGPVTETGVLQPKAVTVRLRRARLDQLLGHAVPDLDVERALKRLGIGLKRLGGTGWQATVPSHRYDLRIEADLIEEVARLYGYERLPARSYSAQLAAGPVPEQVRPTAALADRLVARGYQEVVTYSFVDPKLQQRLTPAAAAIALDNPIAETLAVMRTTLWSGLLPAWQFNQQRQQRRVRLFETGVCFHEQDGRVVEEARIGGLAAGSALPEQWGAPARPTDFFDAKSDVEALLGVDLEQYRFARATHPALHPGQTAQIFRGDRAAGWIGVLHPALVAALDVPEAPVLFELDAGVVQPARLPHPQAPSEFPSARRDLAVVLRDDINSANLLETVRAAGGAWLRQSQVFDVYRGAGLPNGCKSIALSLIFQDNSRTLMDDEVDSAVQAVKVRLTEALGASFRT